MVYLHISLLNNSCSHKFYVNNFSWLFCHTCIWLRLVSKEKLHNGLKPCRALSVNSSKFSMFFFFSCTVYLIQVDLFLKYPLWMKIPSSDLSLMQKICCIKSIINNTTTIVLFRNSLNISQRLRFEDAFLFHIYILLYRRYSLIKITILAKLQYSKLLHQFQNFN